MTLKKKLTLGLGFLFFIILFLGTFSSYHIGRLSQDAENILKDNYNSLVYTKNMTSALEDMRTAVEGIVFNAAADGKASEYDLKLFEAGQLAFESNLKSESNNITEIREQDYVTTVGQDYALYANICRRVLKGGGDRTLYFNEYLPAFEKLRHGIAGINDLNMQAVERKSQKAGRDADRIIKLVAGIGVFCLILAFGYFWYFPFYVSNSIAYLADRMKTLLKRSDILLDLRTEDEAFVILQGINLLENKLGIKDQSAGAKADR